MKVYISEYADFLIWNPGNNILGLGKSNVDAKQERQLLEAILAPVAARGAARLNHRLSHEKQPPTIKPGVVSGWLLIVAQFRMT
jgi:hypothetical protein